MLSIRRYPTNIYWAALAASLVLASHLGAQGPEDNLAAMTFSQMQAHTEQATQSVPIENDQRYFARAELILDWLEAQDLSELSESELFWCIMNSRPHRPGAKAGFRVTWTGNVTAPRSGNYTFSVCPLAISTEFGDSYHRQSITVDVGGQRVVEATPANWKPLGIPISLTGGQPVSIRVTFAYEKNDPWRLAPAVLFWEGPGIELSVVPPSAFSQPSGSDPGLAAEYHWTEEGQAQVRTVVEPNIDFNWTEAGFASERLDLIRRVAAILFAKLGSPEFLLKYGQDGRSTTDEALHPLFQTGSDLYRRALTYTTAAQRAELIETLAASPNVLSAATAPHVVRLYDCLRAGNENAALDLLGTWMQSHADEEPVLSASTKEFYGINRSRFRALAINLALEHSESIAWLEEDYLATEDGRCVLPAAYTLAYAYLMQGNVEGWIELLEAKLADDTLTGDARVNWLIARGMAEEIRDSPPVRHLLARERLDAGREWLEEASLVAESPDKKVRLAKERIARLAALHQWEAAEAEVASYSQPLNDWGIRLSELRNDVSEAAHERTILVRTQYLEELKRRREAAVARGDAASQSRFDRLIQSVEQALPSESE